MAQGSVPESLHYIGPGSNQGNNATATQLGAGSGGQHDVNHADLAQFLEHATGLVAQAGGVAKLRKRLPQHIRQEAHEDVGQHAIISLMPDRSDADYGEMDYRHTERDGKPAVEFSWEGIYEDDHVFGRGWAVLESDQLEGMIFFHHGDSSGFVAKPVEEEPKRKGK